MIWVEQLEIRVAILWIVSLLSGLLSAILVKIISRAEYSISDILKEIFSVDKILMVSLVFSTAISLVATIISLLLC